MSSESVTNGETSILCTVLWDRVLKSQGEQSNTETLDVELFISFECD